MAFRHRHCRLSSLIELAEVEEGKAEVERLKEVCEEGERVISRRDGLCNSFLLHFPMFMLGSRPHVLPPLAYL